MSNLQEILREAITREGAISFARFMELALYCPNFGYYERLDVSPGQKGDFYTSVSVGELFGQLLASQFAEWWEVSAERGVQDAEWQIVEAGAHDGRLAADILRWLRAERKELFGSLEYWILEPSPRRRQTQAAMLSEFAGSVRWLESWETVPATGVHGVIFSNELLDAMPVHRLGWDAANKRWFEWGVMCAGNNFAWTKMPTITDSKFPNSALRTPHSALQEVLPDGFTTEVGPAAVDWWRQAARALKSGKLVAFDYGLLAEQFFTPERRAGTLRAYYQHHQNSDLLARVGEQDITAQVNFSAIQAAGEAEGLATLTFTTQGQFLTSVLARNHAKNPQFAAWTPARTRQFQTLTHPEHLGQSFRVLVQGR